MVKGLSDNELRLESFHNGTSFRAYEFFGCHRVSESEFVFRVWAPHAKSVKIIGLEQDGIPMARLNDNESFEAVTRAEEGQLYAYCITTYDGREVIKADPYAFAADIPNSFYSKVYDLKKDGEYRPENRPTDNL